MYRRQAEVRYQFLNVVLSGFMIRMAAAANQEKIRERMIRRGYNIEEREKVLKYIE
jgi:hypothetical protein